MTTNPSAQVTSSNQVRIVQAALQTPVGVIEVGATELGLRRVSWTRRSVPFTASGDDPAARLAQRALDQLAGYFAGERTEFDLPLDLPRLGESTRTVLLALRDTVGFGQTITYGELAARANLTGPTVPARAIGSIMGSNPVPIVIGCHRVVAADGLGGYSGGEPGRGLQTKTWLLEHEGALPPTLI